MQLYTKYISICPLTASHWQALQTCHLVQGSSSADDYIAPFPIFWCLPFSYLLTLFYNNYDYLFLIFIFVIYSRVQQHSTADSRFKAGSVFREFWSTGLPVLISQLIYQIHYAVWGVPVQSERRETRAVFLTKTFYTINGYH